MIQVRAGCAWFVVLFGLLPGMVAAAEGIGAPPDPFSGGYLVKLTLSLLGVLALLFMLLFLLRRFGGLPRAGRQQDMRVLGSMAVGPRERVVWIDVDGHQLVLGVTSGHIEPLLHVPPTVVADVTTDADPLLDTPSVRASDDPAFRQTLADIELRSGR